MGLGPVVQTRWPNGQAARRRSYPHTARSRRLVLGKDPNNSRAMLSTRVARAARAGASVSAETGSGPRKGLSASPPEAQSAVWHNDNWRARRIAVILHSACEA